MTDWNGIKYDNFVGFGNYIAMFKSKDYVYSFVVTFIYTVINMLSVNNEHLHWHCYVLQK